MELTQEILDLAAKVAEAHKLKEVFYTEKGEFFSSAREGRNSKAKDVIRAFPAPSLKSRAEDVDPVSSEETKGNSLDEQNGHSEATGSPELKASITEDETNTEPAQVTEPVKVEPVAEAPKAEKPKPVKAVKDSQEPTI